jgi:hypothetical protein
MTTFYLRRLTFFIVSSIRSAFSLFRPCSPRHSCLGSAQVLVLHQHSCLGSAQALVPRLCAGTRASAYISIRASAQALVPRLTSAFVPRLTSAFVLSNLCLLRLLSFLRLPSLNGISIFVFFSCLNFVLIFFILFYFSIYIYIYIFLFPVSFCRCRRASDCSTHHVRRSVRIHRDLLDTSATFELPTLEDERNRAQL